MFVAIKTIAVGYIFLYRFHGKMCLKDLKIVKKELGIDKIRELLIDLLIKGQEDTGVYDRASALDAIDAYAPELLNGIEKWRA